MARNIFNRVKISGKTLFFKASASCSKIPNSENIFNAVYSVYIHLGWSV